MWVDFHRASNMTSDILLPSRRGFLLAAANFGLAAAGVIAAPAIIKATSLMPVRAWETDAITTYSRNSLLTINMITREAVRLFKNSNLFLQNLDAQYAEIYRTIDSHGLSIRLPI